MCGLVNGGVTVACWTGDPRGPWIDSCSVHCHITTLGKLITLSPSSISWYWSKSS